MANPYGSKTIGTYLPLPLHTRMLAYLKFNGGSVSSFIRQAIEVKLVNFADAPLYSKEVSAAPAAAMAVYRSIRARLSGLSSLPSMDAYLASLGMHTELKLARPTFELASINECGHKYATAYLELLKVVEAQSATAKEWYAEPRAAGEATK